MVCLRGGIMEQPIMGKIEQLTNVPDYSGGQPHSKNFSHDPYRISNNFDWDEFNKVMAESGKTKPVVEYEIDPHGVKFDLVGELVKKICEAHNGDCELHIKVNGLSV